MIWFFVFLFSSLYGACFYVIGDGDDDDDVILCCLKKVFDIIKKQEETNQAELAAKVAEFKEMKAQHEIVS